MNTVTVKINGMEYNLKGKEDEAYLQNVARYVDSKFREITANNNKLSISSVAILSALNIADELYKCDSELVEINKKKNSLEERNLTLKERLRELKSDMDDMSKNKKIEVEELRNIIYSMESTLVKKEDFESLQEENEKLRGIINSYISEKNLLTNKVEEVTEELENLKSTTISEEMALIIKNENDELKNKIANKEEENIKLKEEIINKESEYTTLKENIVIELDEKHKNINKIEKERMTQIINSKEIEVRNLKEKLECEQAENLEGARRVSQKVIEITRLREAIESVTNDLNKVKELNEKRENELLEEINYKEIEKENIKEEISKKSEIELEEIKEKLLNKEEELKSKTSEIDNLTVTNKDLKFNLQNARYKILDIEKKLSDANFNLAVEKKSKNTLLR